MKQIISIILIITLLLITSAPCVFAEQNRFLISSIDPDTLEEITPLSIEISDVSLEDNNLKVVDSGVDEYILGEMRENENLIIMDIKTDDETNPYPELPSPVSVSVSPRQKSGGRSVQIGKDYRLVKIPKDGSDIADLTDNITDSRPSRVTFTAEETGRFVLFFNPAVYNVTFYLGEEVYKEIDGLTQKEILNFPPVPQKNGYVFTGWKVPAMNGELFYPDPCTFTALTYASYYATWCPEDEYEPLEITVAAEENIKKGKEDGKKVTVKTNYGVFDYNGMYEDWPAHWGVAGSDEITIESATIIDNKTVELVLSGNSEDIYTDSEIYIEFDSSFLLGGCYKEDGIIYYEEAEKIKIDENGIREKIYRSYNSITLTKQKKKRTTTGGGVSLPSMYTVTFNTSGGSEIKTQTLSSGSLVNLPDNPEKEGYIFEGWFTDKELTKEYNFDDKLTKSMTLYAKWEEEDKTNEQIIFTVGDKTAMVFGKEKKNDVAPVIRSDRAFLPARFVAEALGAEVLWDEKTKTVTITKDDIEIALTIDSKTAMVNSKEVTLDAYAFIENDRTYTPIRLIAEALDAKVLWNPDEQNITITKQ